MTPCRIQMSQHRRTGRRATSARLALASLLFTVAPAAALAADAGSLKKISGPSPFANCTADNVAKQSGRNYPQSEIEPWIDANPEDRSNLIAGWQPDRWSNGGSRGLVSGFTTDGGAIWNEVVVPKVTVCAGGRFKRASDPWLSIAPNGTAYFMSLAFQPDLANGSLGRNAMLVNRSTNGG